MNTIEFKFKNGQRVKDIVSGAHGIIDCSALWLNGCIRYSLQPPVKDGDTTRPEAWWIDEGQLRLIDEGVVDIVSPQKTGGPSFKSDKERI